MVDLFLDKLLPKIYFDWLYIIFFIVHVYLLWCILFCSRHKLAHDDRTFVFENRAFCVNHGFTGLFRVGVGVCKAYVLVAR